MNFPNRPNKKISQSFNDGVVDIYSVENKAEAGYKPVFDLSAKYKLRFNENRLGINRYYSALQNQIKVAKVIRVNRLPITNQDIAIIDDVQYRIDMVQAVEDVYPPCIDLTLVKIEQEDEYAL